MKKNKLLCPFLLLAVFISPSYSFGLNFDRPIINIEGPNPQCDRNDKPLFPEVVSENCAQAICIGDKWIVRFPNQSEPEIQLEENCEKPSDDNCNGFINENCSEEGNPEICNLIDDDLDGIIDEGCRNGLQEICGNFIDDDLDGAVDEGCSECQPETCNHIDDDCDGFVDEGCEIEQENFFIDKRKVFGSCFSTANNTVGCLKENKFCDTEFNTDSCTTCDGENKRQVCTFINKEKICDDCLNLDQFSCQVNFLNKLRNLDPIIYNAKPLSVWFTSPQMDCGSTTTCLTDDQNLGCLSIDEEENIQCLNSLDSCTIECNDQSSKTNICLAVGDIIDYVSPLHSKTLVKLINSLPDQICSECDDSLDTSCLDQYFASLETQINNPEISSIILNEIIRPIYSPNDQNIKQRTLLKIKNNCRLNSSNSIDNLNEDELALETNGSSKVGDNTNTDNPNQNTPDNELNNEQGQANSATSGGGGCSLRRT